MYQMQQTFEFVGNLVFTKTEYIFIITINVKIVGINIGIFFYYKIYCAIIIILFCKILATVTHKM